MKPIRITPGPGQESVWDYPRPPRLEPFGGAISIRFNGEVLAETKVAFRILETSHPPVYYLSPDSIRMEWLIPSERRSSCEYKGEAAYYHMRVRDQLAMDAAWVYPSILPDYKQIEGYLAFYAHKMEACYVDDERVDAQAGSFYGGWITSRIVGPFKGTPGTWGW